MIPVGATVLAEAVGDSLSWDAIHLPAPVFTWGLRQGFSMTLEEAERSCKLEWRSLCGVDGWLYVFDGPVAKIAPCARCVALAKAAA